MLVTRTTHLPLAPEAACALAQKPALFQHVVWPLFTTGSLPERLEVGERASARLYLAGVVPAWRHHLQLVALEPCEIRTNEGGGPVAVWNHTLTFEPASDGGCRYTDAIEVRAGLATLPAVLVAHLIFRWRHRRWRALARVLA